MKLFVEETGHIILQILPQSKFFDTIPVLLFNISSVEQSNPICPHRQYSKNISKTDQQQQIQGYQSVKHYLALNSRKREVKAQKQGLQWKGYPGDKSLGTYLCHLHW